ncbi:unnamed protein product [Zymoseptoria tritici ST99CH_3D1]|nr:unnamed protein product [Zymoseptoria tritici ST99CH_3D1]
MPKRKKEGPPPVTQVVAAYKKMQMEGYGFRNQAEYLGVVENTVDIVKAFHHEEYVGHQIEKRAAKLKITSLSDADFQSLSDVMAASRRRTLTAFEPPQDGKAEQLITSLTSENDLLKQQVETLKEQVEQLKSKTDSMDQNERQSKQASRDRAFWTEKEHQVYQELRKLHKHFGKPDTLPSDEKAYSTALQQLHGYKEMHDSRIRVRSKTTTLKAKLDALLDGQTEEEMEADCAWHNEQLSVLATKVVEMNARKARIEAAVVEQDRMQLKLESFRDFGPFEPDPDHISHVRALVTGFEFAVCLDEDELAAIRIQHKKLATEAEQMRKSNKTRQDELTKSHKDISAVTKSLVALKLEKEELTEKSAQYSAAGLSHRKSQEATTKSNARLDKDVKALDTKLRQAHQDHIAAKVEDSRLKIKKDELESQIKAAGEDWEKLQANVIDDAEVDDLEATLRTSSREYSVAWIEDIHAQEASLALRRATDDTRDTHYTFMQQNPAVDRDKVREELKTLQLEIATAETQRDLDRMHVDHITSKTTSLRTEREDEAQDSSRVSLETAKGDFSNEIKLSTDHMLQRSEVDIIQAETTRLELEKSTVDWESQKSSALSDLETLRTQSYQNESANMIGKSTVESLKAAKSGIVVEALTDFDQQHKDLRRQLNEQQDLAVRNKVANRAGQIEAQSLETTKSEIEIEPLRDYPALNRTVWRGLEDRLKESNAAQLANKSAKYQLELRSAMLMDVQVEPVKDCTIQLQTTDDALRARVKSAADNRAANLRAQYEVDAVKAARAKVVLPPVKDYHSLLRDAESTLSEAQNAVTAHKVHESEEASLLAETKRLLAQRSTSTDEDRATRKSTLKLLKEACSTDAERQAREDIQTMKDEMLRHELQTLRERNPLPTGQVPQIDHTLVSPQIRQMLAESIKALGNRLCAELLEDFWTAKGKNVDDETANFRQNSPANGKKKTMDVDGVKRKLEIFSADMNKDALFAVVVADRKLHRKLQLDGAQVVASALEQITDTAKPLQAHDATFADISAVFENLRGYSDQIIKSVPADARQTFRQALLPGQTAMQAIKDEANYHDQLQSTAMVLGAVLHLMFRMWQPDLTLDAAQTCQRLREIATMSLPTPDTGSILMARLEEIS